MLLWCSRALTFYIYFVEMFSRNQFYSFPASFLIIF